MAEEYDAEDADKANGSSSRIVSQILGSAAGVERRGYRYVQFRDVFDADGLPVRIGSERLLKVFLTPSASTTKQAAQIMAQSARYNIGIERNYRAAMNFCRAAPGI